MTTAAAMSAERRLADGRGRSATVSLASGTSSGWSHSARRAPSRRSPDEADGLSTNSAIRNEIEAERAANPGDGSVPDAPDAPATRDKVLVWKVKADEKC
jgi:hypothetical protein